MVRRMIPALALGGAAVAMLLLAMALAASADVWSVLRSAFAPVLLLALFVLALRSLAFLARVIPVVGSLAQAMISTGLFLWLMGQGVKVAGLTAAPAGMSGLEGPAIGMCA